MPGIEAFDQIQGKVGCCRVLDEVGLPQPPWPVFAGRGPPTLRHAFITAALDAGAALRGVQEAASHADPRTTMRHDRARASLDRHASHVVAAYVAEAAR